MSDRNALAIRFLTSMAQALATMSLYAEGHPVRARAGVASFDTLRDLQKVDPRPSFSFLGSDVVYGQQAMRGLTDWEWATRLANVGGGGRQAAQLGGRTLPECRPARDLSNGDGREYGPAQSCSRSVSELKQRRALTFAARK
jgi:hypothetical protein